MGAHSETVLAMKSAIVKIGNSQGVRIPKRLLEEAGISGPVELRAEVGRIVVERTDHPLPPIPPQSTEVQKGRYFKVVSRR